MRESRAARAWWERASWSMVGFRVVNDELGSIRILGAYRIPML